jgi:hypothetical protein
MPASNRHTVWRSSRVAIKFRSVTTMEPNAQFSEGVLAQLGMLTRSGVGSGAMPRTRRILP